MKILYAGNLDCYGTAYSRLNALKAHAGKSNVVEFDISPFVKEIASAPRWKRDYRALRIHSKINSALLDSCRLGEADVLWLDTAEWISRKAINELRGLGVFLARHTTDALFPRRPVRLRLRRHWLRRLMPEFDLVFTSNERDCDQLRRVYGERFQLTDLGYDHQRFNNDPLPAKAAKEWDNDVVFVGHYEKRTERAVIALIEAGIDVTVYGHEPWFRSRNRDCLGDHLKPRLSNEDYEASLKGTKIGLCCISEWNYNQTSARSFEIPASGSFLLAMRTERHKQFYEEGVEAEFFDSHSELVRKAKHYLSNTEERERIAVAGQQRASESGYSWQAIMGRDFAKLKAAYEEWSFK